MLHLTRAVCWSHAHRDLCLQEAREGTDAPALRWDGKWDNAHNARTFLYTGLGCWGGHLSAGKFQNKAYYTFSELCRTDHHNNHHPRRQQRTRETSAFACLGIKVGGGFSSTPLCLKTSAWLTAWIQYVWLQGTDHHRGFPWWPPSCVHSSNTLLASFTWDEDVSLEGLGCRARENSAKQGLYSLCSAVSTVMRPYCQDCPSDNEKHCKNKRTAPSPLVRRLQEGLCEKYNLQTSEMSRGRACGSLQVR